MSGEHGELSKVQQLLKIELEARRLVVVLGAGVSRSLNDKSKNWAELLESGLVYADLELKAHQALHVLITSGDVDFMLSAAEAIKTKLVNRGKWRGWLKHEFEPLKNTDTASEMALLFGRMGAPIITTNYDLLLDHALGFSSISLSDTQATLDWVRGLDQGETTKILHLHGCFDKEDTVALSTRDYQRLLGDESAQALQQTLFISKTLLFIGCGNGVDDLNIGACIKSVATFFKPERLHFWLRREEDITAEPRGSLIQQVSYGKGHGDLLPFLKPLCPETPSLSLPLPSAYFEGSNKLAFSTFVHQLRNPSPLRLHVRGAFGIGRKTFISRALKEKDVAEHFSGRIYVVRAERVGTWAELQLAIGRELFPFISHAPCTLENIARFLQARPTILVVADCDEVVRREGERVNEATKKLIEAGRAKIVFTSQASVILQIPAAQRFDLKPLPDGDAVDLFCHLAEPEI